MITDNGMEDWFQNHSHLTLNQWLATDGGKAFAARQTEEGRQQQRLFGEGGEFYGLNAALQYRLWDCGYRTRAEIKAVILNNPQKLVKARNIGYVSIQRLLKWLNLPPLAERERCKCCGRWLPRPKTAKRPIDKLNLIKPKGFDLQTLT